MTRPAQHLLMALAFDVYWTLVVMLRERGLLIWLTLAIFAWLRLPAASRPPALLLAAAGCGLDACWALAGLIDFRGDSLLPFDVRGLNVQAQGDAGGGDDRDLMNQMLAHHHQRRHFCRRCGAGAGGVALAQRFAVMPHRGVKGLIAHCASRRW